LLKTIRVNKSIRQNNVNRRKGNKNVTVVAKAARLTENSYGETAVEREGHTSLNVKKNHTSSDAYLQKLRGKH